MPCSNSAQLILSGTEISALPAGSYVLRAEATNFVRQPSSLKYDFKKQRQVEVKAPAVSILGGKTQTFVISKGIRVTSALIESSLCNRSVSSAWLAMRVWYP